MTYDVLEPDLVEPVEGEAGDVRYRGGGGALCRLSRVGGLGIGQTGS